MFGYYDWECPECHMAGHFCICFEEKADDDSE